ncbi:uncharacterized protein LOC100881700 isoform X2 [Megachile rotundata]|uniref:uncharacterized protein LOC100881700 isoform X2 n=2 Tax=Megachile rotundata TaxID=143995 RepID=UPI000614DF13|nr:PREDICTED: uncharacterized protein LOC100881700 [Megachile rotundata]
MRSHSVPVCFVYVLLSGLVLSTSSSAEPSPDSNSTKIVIEEEDESFPEITLAEFKERYRRLIPYMTYYVANNYVNAQSAVQPQNPSLKDFQTNHLVRNNQPYARVNNLPKESNNYRVNVQNQEKKFVPSVQFDPRNVGGDTDYFAPVKYTSKFAYEDYSLPYQLYRDQKASYPEITTASSQITQKENRYYANVRPLRPYTTNGRDNLPRKQLAKPILANVQDEYVLDYNIRPTGNPAIHYPVKDIQGHRYPPPYSDVQVLDSVPEKQPPILPPSHRNPNVNLQQIIDSFLLSERLPEMLNKDNLDNSLKTLVEILNILHNTRKDELPKIQALPPRLPQKVRNYKVRPQTRPKVITESRFQATPNPLYLTDDPERYKVTKTSYDEEPKPKPSQSNYNTNGLISNKVVEYYIPVVQEIPTKNKDIFLPTNSPQIEGDQVDHSYEITEDLNDDIMQQERFTVPSVTTESPVYSYTEPNEISTSHKTEPQVKYGATRGKANVDYPAYASIPATSFSCKQQRYKGFFGDPETGCQVWHYCDLNGGKSSFLCPNGTIFSQVALTCDWWFNVKCETTTQLYVLNERLYKYILPVMPKFPEDFTGPEVDRYLELKFKEMEAKLKEKKLKKQQEDKEKLKDKPQPAKENE